MRRLALLLAASLLGTGCIVSDSTPVAPPCYPSTITVRWPSFLLANGGVTTSCATAGVAFVDVFLGGASVQRLSCGAGGLTITAPPAGSSVLTVEGVASDGTTILLRDELNVAPSACGDVVVDAQPAEGTLELAYTFTPVNVCTAGGSYMWFSVYDRILGNVAAVADETANTRLYVCSDLIRFPLPAGSYTLQRMEEVVSSGGAYVASAVNCNQTNFDVGRATDSVVNVALVDSSTLCP
jgi:hypothetical protein